MQGNYNEDDGYTGFTYKPPEAAEPGSGSRDTAEPFDQYLSAGVPAGQQGAQDPDDTPKIQYPLPDNYSEPFYGQPLQDNYSEPISGQPLPEIYSEPFSTQSQPDNYSEPFSGQPLPDSYSEPLDGRFAMPPAHAWQEPAYSQTQEQAYKMYSPGICAGQPYYNKQNAGVNNKRKREAHSGRAGRFLRTACVIVLCVVLSGASAYGIMEYRLQRGDFNVIVNNQVVLGGSHTTQSGGVLSPIYATGGEMPAEDIYDLARSHVVGINTETDGSGSIPGMSISTTVTSGSGFIISSDGYILTNYHVIETAYQNNFSLMVYLADGTAYEAEIIGYESNSDFAIIKIDAAGLNPAVIGDSDSLRVGQKVYAVGNPFGDLVYTMTEGIVSALDRQVTVERKTIDTFQFSAAVNPGNSGGPIYNANGEVVGIVTAKFMRDSVEGIGFAIPINDAINIASELIEHGYITGRPLMGITVDTFDDGYAEYYEMIVGARVKSVAPGSAAETAGILVGDIIIALGDTKIESSNALIYALRKYRANDTESITVWRSGDEIEMTITFDENLSAGQPQQPQQQEPQQQQQPQQPQRKQQQDEFKPPEQTPNP